MVASDQFNRMFAIGLAGATIASMGLYTLSDADETRDDSRRQSAQSDVGRRSPVDNRSREPCGRT